MASDIRTSIRTRRSAPIRCPTAWQLGQAGTNAVSRHRLSRSQTGWRVAPPKRAGRSSSDRGCCRRGIADRQKLPLGIEQKGEIHRQRHLARRRRRAHSVGLSGHAAPRRSEADRAHVRRRPCSAPRSRRPDPGMSHARLATRLRRAALAAFSTSRVSAGDSTLSLARLPN